MLKVFNSRADAENWLMHSLDEENSRLDEEDSIRLDAIYVQIKQLKAQINELKAQAANIVCVQSQRKRDYRKKRGLYNAYEPALIAIEEYDDMIIYKFDDGNELVMKPVKLS